MKFWNTIHNRWRNTMPKFFRIICWICSLISGTALAMNEVMHTGGATPPDWWSDIYPYLLSIPAGMAFMAKFTQSYDDHGNPIRKGLEAQSPEKQYNDSDITTRTPHEIEPYDDGPDA